MIRSNLIERLEATHGKPIREILREQFALGKTQGEIADTLGISYYTLRYWLHRLRAEQIVMLRFPEDERAIVP